MIRVPTMGKASAKVSTTVTPLSFSSGIARAQNRQEGGQQRWERRKRRLEACASFLHCRSAIAAHH
jgi:hypothetical protein